MYDMVLLSIVVAFESISGYLWILKGQFGILNSHFGTLFGGSC